MNIETFNALATQIIEDADKTDVVNKLNTLVAALHNRMNQPAEPSYVAAVDQQLSELRVLLPSLATNRFPPLWKEYLTELNSHRLIGNELLSDIEDIFTRNSITPTLAHNELKEIADEITTDLTELRAAQGALYRFGVGTDRPMPGEAEIGVLIPRTAVHENLSEFGAELQKLSRIIKVFHETVHGDRPDIKLKTVASSEYSILCSIDWETAKLIAESVSKMIEGYKSILSLKKTIQNLRDEGVPEDKLGSLVEHANDKMGTTVEAISEEIIKQFPGGKTETTRRREIKIEIRGALGEVATRVDKGFSFEVRTAAPDAVTGEDDPAESQAKELRMKEHHEMLEKQAVMQFLKPHGEPILSLPGLADTEAKKANTKPAATA